MDDPRQSLVPRLFTRVITPLAVAIAGAWGVRGFVDGRVRGGAYSVVFAFVSVVAGNALHRRTIGVESKRLATRTVIYQACAFFACLGLACLTGAALILGGAIQGGAGLVIGNLAGAGGCVYVLIKAASHRDEWPPKSNDHDRSGKSGGAQP